MAPGAVLALGREGLVPFSHVIVIVICFLKYCNVATIP